MGNKNIELLTQGLERQNELLQTWKHTSQILLVTENSENIETALTESMKVIGLSMDVDRVHLWQNKTIDDALHFVLIHEWLSEYASTITALPIGQKFSYIEKPEWKEQFSRGEIVNTQLSQMSSDDRVFFGIFDIKSILIIPLFLQGTFWGFFSLADCVHERLFTENEIDVVQSTSLMMANIINRNMQAAKLREAHERTQLLLDATPYACHLWNNMSQVFDCNEENVRLFKTRSKQSFCDNFYDTIPEYQPDGTLSIDVVEEGKAHAHKRGRYVREFVHQTIDGTPIPCEVTLVRVSYDGDYALAAYIRDLREHKRMMQELERRDEELRTAVKAAKDANAAKSSFLANMSHEIRTPMNAIIGMTQIAAKTEDTEKLKYCLDNIENSSKHLLAVINDVLDISKIEAGKLELDNSPLNIEKMLIRISSIFSEKTEQKNMNFNIILSCGMKLRYIGDELRLSQVITNLLSNAIKFTPIKGHIELTVEDVQIDERYSVLRFAVKDSGIGMTQEQIDKLFTAFQQAEGSISSKFGGTGLGLAISKSIVEKMDGRIWCESEPGKGSAFIFEVRLEREQQQNNAVIYEGIRPADIRLLIAAPTEKERTYLKSIADSFGIAADEAATVEQAMCFVAQEKNQNNPYDVIFIDDVFVNDENIELVKRVGIEEDGENIVVMTTFLNWNRFEDSLKDIGVKRFILKPVFPSPILDSINEIIGAFSKKANIISNEYKSVPNFSNLTLLFAEDVEINREIFFALLEDTKIKIDVAENGLIAFEKFKENPKKYDAIIMDVQMPVMDGLEATMAIRDLDIERAKSIPIVAMTANVFREDVEKCFDAGINDHLAKPVILETLIEKITKYCKVEKTS